MAYLAKIILQSVSRPLLNIVELTLLHVRVFYVLCICQMTLPR